MKHAANDLATPSDNAAVIGDSAKHNGKLIAAILSDHQLWLNGEGGERASLSYADLRYASLRDASLSYANLRYADLRNANLSYANLSYADLSNASLRNADLLCQGNMREIRTMQIDTWATGYTADTLQIGCQRHPIDKWRKWSTEAGRKWVAAMDPKAADWADRNLSLVLQIIDANPATPTKAEACQ